MKCYLCRLNRAKIVKQGYSYCQACLEKEAYQDKVLGFIILGIMLVGFICVWFACLIWEGQKTNH